MPAKQYWQRRLLLNREFSGALDEPLLAFRTIPMFARHMRSISTQRICLRDSIKQIQFALARQPAKRTVANLFAFLVKLARLQMVAHEGNHLPPHIVTGERVQVEPIQK